MNHSKSTDKKNLLCTVYILLGGSLWGMMGLFVRGLAADALTSVDIATLRSIGAAVFMGLYLFAKDKKLFKIKIKDIWCFVGTGVVSLTFFNICYFTTIQRTSMAVAAILLYTSPIFIVLLSFFLFKEKITGTKAIALVVALLGVAFVTGVISTLISGTSADAASISMATILIGLGSGLGYALYSIFGRYAIAREYSSETITFYTFLFSALGLTLCTLLLGDKNGTGLFGTFHAMTEKIISGRTGVDILLIIGLSVVITILPYLFYTKGLTGVENGKAGIMASIEPVVAAVLGMLVYGEVLSLSGYIGIVLVLAAIVMLNKK